MGVKEDVIDIISCDIHTFSVVLMLRTKNDNSMWRLISVYGSAYDAFKLDFIQELHMVFDMWDGPTMISRDFNLVREACDKNTGEINQHWADLFNDWINRYGLL